MPENRTIVAFAFIAGTGIMAALPESGSSRTPDRISFMQSPAVTTLPHPSSAHSSQSIGTASVKRRADGHYWATADVNGFKLDLLVDTGASKVVLSQEDARRIGINTYSLDYDGIASTANGEVRTALVSIDRLRIGGVMVDDVPTLVTEGDLDTSLLGMSFLGALESFEFKGDALILRE